MALTREQLAGIVEEQNRQAEEQTAQTARSLIGYIIQQQQAIARAEQAIEQFRKQLRELTTPTIDVNEVLGGE